MQEILFELAKTAGQILKAKNLRIVTAESCTGGGLAYWLTAVSGSSDWFDRGLITYQDQAKAELLHIPISLIEQYGAVSEEVALQMAQQALKISPAQVSIAITGIAGPTGGTPNKPVGLVFIAWKTPTTQKVTAFHFLGDRTAVREQTIASALEQLIVLLKWEWGTTATGGLRVRIFNSEMGTL